MRNVFLDTYNLAVSMAIAVLSAVFGEFWYLFTGFMILNVFDWITGWMRAKKQNQESSAAGLKGISKKLWYWILIAVGFLISYLLSRLGQDLWGIDLQYMSFVGWFTLGNLVVNEARSIIENLMALEVPVPAFLVKGLAVTHRMLEKEAAVLFHEDTKTDEDD